MEGGRGDRQEERQRTGERESRETKEERKMCVLIFLPIMSCVRMTRVNVFSNYAFCSLFTTATCIIILNLCGSAFLFGTLCFNRKSSGINGRRNLFGLHSRGRDSLCHLQPYQEKVRKAI